MGWKNVKKYYHIVHSVHITDQGLCIGSPFVHNLIVVDMTGVVTERRESGNDDLIRYLAEFDADPHKLRELIQSPDEFTESVPVYTFEGAEIVEKQCEQHGWPNVTHDGCLMYDDTFFEDKAAAVEQAKREAAAGVRLTEGRIKELHTQLAGAEVLLKESQADLATLDAAYPDV